jgi:hypothetical protein
MNIRQLFVRNSSKIRQAIRRRYKRDFKYNSLVECGTAYRETSVKFGKGDKNWFWFLSTFSIRHVGWIGAAGIILAYNATRSAMEWTTSWAHELSNIEAMTSIMVMGITCCLLEMSRYFAYKSLLNVEKTGPLTVLDKIKYTLASVDYMAEVHPLNGLLYTTAFIWSSHIYVAPACYLLASLISMAFSAPAFAVSPGSAFAASHTKIESPRDLLFDTDDGDSIMGCCMSWELISVQMAEDLISTRPARGRIHYSPQRASVGEMTIKEVWMVGEEMHTRLHHPEYVHGCVVAV